MPVIIVSYTDLDFSLPACYDTGMYVVYYFTYVY